MRPQSRLSGLRLPIAGLPLLAALALGHAVQAQSAARMAIPGQPFPPGIYKVFNPRGEADSVNLHTLLGQRPVILCYWIPGNERAEKVFLETLDLVKEVGGSDKVQLLGVAVLNPGIGLTEKVVREKIAELAIGVPVINDEDFKIGRSLGVRSVPHITIVDKTGNTRLTNGASLTQVLEYKVDLAGAIRRLADSGELLTYGVLSPYYPVKELEGQPAPDFKAPLLADSVEQRWSSLLDDDKINVLIFWSVDCPHCQKSLPQINAWVKQNPEDVNVVSCASVANETGKVKTQEFCRLHDIAFPTLVDRDAEIGSLYGVTTTPTIVIIGPDGVVDAAITSSTTDFGATIEAKKRKLLKPAG